MTDLRTAAQQALEALEEWHGAYPHRVEEDDIEVAEALRAALAEPIEPVAWTLTKTLTERKTTTNGYLWFSDPQNSSWTPLYTSPPQRPAEPVQEPVAFAHINGTSDTKRHQQQRKPLTEEEIDGLMQSIGLRCADDGNERMANHAEWERRQRRRIARAIERAHGIV